MSSPQKISPPQKPFALPSAKIPFATASKSPSYPEDTKPDDTSPYLKSNEQGLQLVDHSNEGYLGEVTNVWDNALTIPPAQSVQFSNSKILRLINFLLKMFWLQILKFRDEWDHSYLKWVI